MFFSKNMYKSHNNYWTDLKNKQSCFRFKFPNNFNNNSENDAVTVILNIEHMPNSHTHV